MIQKAVKAGDRKAAFRSAAIPRLYRMKLRRDIYKDLSKLEQPYNDKGDGSKELEIEDLEIFGIVAYRFLYSATRY